MNQLKAQAGAGKAVMLSLWRTLVIWAIDSLMVYLFVCVCVFMSMNDLVIYLFK